MHTLRPIIPGGLSAPKKKPLRKAAVDLVSLDRLDEIVGFRDFQVASLTGSALAEPHCRALQAPARATAAKRGNLETKSKPPHDLTTSASAGPETNLAARAGSVKLGFCLAGPKLARHGNLPHPGD